MIVFNLLFFLKRDAWQIHATTWMKSENSMLNQRRHNKGHIAETK